VTARYLDHLTNGAAIEAPERADLAEPGGWLALAGARRSANQRICKAGYHPAGPSLRSSQGLC
jgi:hypothetical protein